MQLNIGILSRSADLYSTRSLIEAGERAGHTMHVIDHTMCSLTLLGEQVSVLYKGQPLNVLDAVIPRIGASVTGLGAAIIQQFDLMGIVSPTSASALLQARDKLWCLQLLQQAKVPIPRTIMATYSTNLKMAVQQLGGLPIVIKLLESTHGIGVELAETSWALERLLDNLFIHNDKILLQEYLAEAHGADTRVLVVDKQIVAVMERQAQDGDFRSNLHRGATARAITLDAATEKVVHQAIDVLGIEVAGVDIMHSRRGPLVIEVNASPGLEGIETVTGVDVAGHIIRLVEKKYAAKL